MVKRRKASGVGEASVPPTPSTSERETLKASVASLSGLNVDQLGLQWRNHLGGVAPAHLPGWLLMPSARRAGPRRPRTTPPDCSCASSPQEREGIAKPGAICLSEDAYRQVKARWEPMISPRMAAHLGPQTRFGSSNGLPKAQPETAAETPGDTMKSTYGRTLRARKITGVHQSMDNAVPAAPNPRAAEVRGHPLRSVAT